MAGHWMQTRQTKYAAYVTLYIIVILAVLVVANFLANRYNKSFDATSNKRYSLSDQTKKVVGELKQDVTISYFDRASGMQAGKDLLDRYHNLSPKIHIQYVDLLKNPTLARAENVSREGEAVVTIGARREDAKTFDEEGVTGALIRALKGSARNVCVVSGHGEHGLQDSQEEGLSNFQTVVQRDNYKVQSINLQQKAEVPSGCTLLVVAGPTGDYIQPEVDAIKKYVESGGRALFMLDPPLQVGRKPISENATLDAMLEGWGITPDKDLLLDESAASQLLGGGPTAPVILKYDSHPIVNDLTNVSTAFPLSRSLTTKNTDKTNNTILFSTSEDSFSTNNLSSPEIRIDPNKDKHGPFTLAVAGTYNGGAKPANSGRYVVVGNSGWASNQALGFSGNRNLLLNMINWLSSDEDLISIRPKEPEDRRINLTRAQFRTIQATSQFFLPFIVIMGGVMVWLKRR